MVEIINLYPDKLPLPRTKEEADEKLLEVRVSFANDLSDFIMDEIMNIVDRAGFPLGPKSDKDIVNLKETVKSFLYRTIDVNHVFHNEIDERVTDEDIREYQEENRQNFILELL